MSKLATIEASTAMEKANMVMEDVFEEHNGVYGGKWHIFSSEGFDLPEGLEYLKNSCEGDEDNWIYRYVPTIAVERIPLKTVIEKLNEIMSERGESIALELSQCSEKGDFSYNNYNLLNHCNKIKIQGSILTFKNLEDIIMGISIGECHIDLSENVFQYTEKDWKLVDNIKNFFEGADSSVDNIKTFKMENCNFTESEREILKTKLRCCGIHI